MAPATKMSKIKLDSSIVTTPILHRYVLALAPYLVSFFDITMTDLLSGIYPQAQTTKAIADIA